MALTWSPNSCWCKFEITSDSKKITLVKVLHKCLEHENMRDQESFRSAWKKGKKINKETGKTPSQKSEEKLRSKQNTKNI